MNENSVLLVHLDGTAINPRSVDAVWIYTAGDVVVNVRAGGMTFKQTFPTLDDNGKRSDETMKRQQEQGNALFQGILGIMYQVANPDTP